MLVHFNRKAAAVLSGVAASLLFAAPAATVQERPVVVYAQPSDVRTERVSYADLDLSQSSQVKRLTQRVAGAVKRVCLFENGRSGLQYRGYYSCADDAWDGARPQIAQAITRAREIALTGRSSIAAAAITFSVPGK